MNAKDLNQATRELNRTLSSTKQTGSVTVQTHVGTVSIIAEQYLNNRGNGINSGSLMVRNVYKLEGKRIAYAALCKMLG